MRARKACQAAAAAGAHGVAIMCDIMTDNRNRTAPELRKMFEIHGGNMGATNCVAWLFERKGLFLVPREGSDEETIMETISHVMPINAASKRNINDSMRPWSVLGIKLPGNEMGLYVFVIFSLKINCEQNEQND